MEVVVGLAIGSAITIAAVTSLAVGLRVLPGLALRLESDDIAAQAAEALTFDVRRAGFDPRGTGIDAVTEATADRLALQADLDGDGTIDVASEEATTYACDVAGRRFSRILGGQSLPLAHGVTGCSLRFHDRDGLELVPLPGGLDATARAALRLVTLDLAMIGGGVLAPTTLQTSIALRGQP
jgi:hypothetical protein